MNALTMPTPKRTPLLLIGIAASLFWVGSAHGEAAADRESLWSLAKSVQNDLTVATLFTEQAVREELATPEQVDKAIRWCKFHGITKVYLETFRNRKQGSREVLTRARDMFAKEGFLVSGCITTTQIGKLALFPDEHGKMISRHLSCYTSSVTQDALQGIFEFTASIFDEIMIDDFYNTNCECDECTAAKGDRTWTQYRSDLLLKVSEQQVIAATRKVNPNSRVIIKYPNWYDHHLSAGYDTDRETKLFPYIYTGTETREPDSMGSNPQYGAYFLMRWLNEVGQGKNMGGWFDYIDTTPKTYVEQARQTVLGGASEMMLFFYAALILPEEEGDINALHKEMPQLFRLAQLIKNKTPRGIITPKSPSSSDLHDKNNKLGEDKYLFSFAGMIGLPLVPTVTVPDDAKAAFFTLHTLYDPGNLASMKMVIERGTPVLVTDGLHKSMENATITKSGNVQILEVGDKNRNVLLLPEEKLNSLRDHILAPFGITFAGPARVAIYPFDADLLVIENFNDRSIQAQYSQAGLKSIGNLFNIPADTKPSLKLNGNTISIDLPARSLAVISLKR